MNVTNEQQHAADKVIEAALLLQHTLRNARKVGVLAHVSVLQYTDDTVTVSARCYVREEQTLRDTEKRKSGR